nr:MAG TPA: hypothetical protein [Caudoviricetes sp.]
MNYLRFRYSERLTEIPNSLRNLILKESIMSWKIIKKY